MSLLGMTMSERMQVVGSYVMKDGLSRDVTFDESSLLKSNVERIEQEQVSPNQQIQLEAIPFFES